MDAVSGQKDGETSSRQRVSTTLPQSDKEGEKTFSKTVNIMAKQREGRSGQHLADSSTLPSVVVKATRALSSI